MTERQLAVLIGSAAVLFPALHTLSDVLELRNGRFSPPQLWINYVAFVGIPFMPLGLHAVQRPWTGWLSLSGALLYGAAFVFFAATTVYALVGRTRDYATLLNELGMVYTAHGAMMVAGGLLFGWGVMRAGVLPRWTGATLAAGVLLHLLSSAVRLPELTQIAGSTLRNVAFVAMGISVLRRRNARWASPTCHSSTTST
jgi:hypothetical protein